MEFTSDDIVDRVQRYYSSHILYEHQVRIVRASGATYVRKSAGNKLELEITDKSLRENAETKFRGDF